MTWHPADALEQSEASNHTPQDSTRPVHSPRQVQPGLQRHWPTANLKRNATN
ncbi:hypothetical protein [Rhodopirellula bahusiensis]|uniref:hypothetical protein n=1 Tax=Rhodopirellula bahusiensis TaxID=2014065 RepID=UPI0036F2302F